MLSNRKVLDMKVGVALHFGNRTPWSGVIRKGNIFLSTYLLNATTVGKAQL